MRTAAALGGGGLVFFGLGVASLKGLNIKD
jgi:hypothetical protein